MTNFSTEEFTVNLTSEDNMVIAKKKKGTHKRHKVGQPGSESDSAQDIQEHGAEDYEQAEHTVSDVYDKTAQAVNETCEQAKIYSRKKPGKAILIVLGIGVGLGFLLGVRSRATRSGRFAKPVVNALSEIALESFR